MGDLSMRRNADYTSDYFYGGDIMNFENQQSGSILLDQIGKEELAKEGALVGLMTRSVEIALFIVVLSRL